MPVENLGVNDPYPSMSVDDQINWGHLSVRLLGTKTVSVGVEPVRYVSFVSVASSRYTSPDPTSSILFIRDESTGIFVPKDDNPEEEADTSTAVSKFVETFRDFAPVRRLVFSYKDIKMVTLCDEVAEVDVIDKKILDLIIQTNLHASDLFVPSRRDTSVEIENVESVVSPAPQKSVEPQPRPPRAKRVATTSTNPEEAIYRPLDPEHKRTFDRWRQRIIEENAQHSRRK